MTYAIPQITRPFEIEINLPGSKSIALRQLAMSALTSEATVLSGVPECDDADAMIGALQALGVGIDQVGDDLRLTGPMDFQSDVMINARMSGASTRLLLGLAALRSGQTTIDGHESLRARTNTPLLDVLSRHGCAVEAPEHGGLPTTIRGPITVQTLIEIDGSISSQYITGLLCALPHLPERTEIKITGSLVSRPYIDITLNEMRRRGGTAGWLSEDTLFVEPGSYIGGHHIVEGDATAATYFAGLATLHQSTVHLKNLGSASCQGDYAFMDIMSELGAEVEKTEASTVIKGPQKLHALGELDMTKMPDAALTLIAMSPMLPGATKITGLSSLHHKECDRLKCPAKEMNDMGIASEITEDTFGMSGHDLSNVSPHLLTTYHDHRMAMAFSLLGSQTGSITVDDERVVDKTYPDYWQDYAKAVGS